MNERGVCTRGVCARAARYPSCSPQRRLRNPKTRSCSEWSTPHPLAPRRRRCCRERQASCLCPPWCARTMATSGHDAVPAIGEDEAAELQRQRANHIRRNMEMMARMGLLDAAKDLRPEKETAEAPKKRVKKARRSAGFPPAELSARIRQHQQRRPIRVEGGVLRRSRFLRGVGAATARPDPLPPAVTATRPDLPAGARRARRRPRDAAVGAPPGRAGRDAGRDRHVRVERRRRGECSASAGQRLRLMPAVAFGRRRLPPRRAEPAAREGEGRAGGQPGHPGGRPGVARPDAQGAARGAPLSERRSDGAHHRGSNCVTTGPGAPNLPVAAPRAEPGERGVQVEG